MELIIDANQVNYALFKISKNEDWMNGDNNRG